VIFHHPKPFEAPLASPSARSAAVMSSLSDLFADHVSEQRTPASLATPRATKSRTPPPRTSQARAPPTITRRATLTPQDKAAAPLRKRQLSSAPSKQRGFRSAWPACHVEATRACAQCRFLNNIEGWQRTCGAHYHRAGRHTDSVVWLSERPVRLGGTFGMGCRVCASLLDRLGGAPADLRGSPLARRRFSTKWGRFEVSGVACMQAECIKQHAASALHKTAMRCFLAPDAPIVFAVPDDDDEELTRGRTPQLEHWVRVWAMVKNPTSYHAAARMQATEAFLSRIRSPGAADAASRKALAAMVNIMAEAIRCEKREVLRHSTAVCLSLDGRGAYRVIRYRCCVEPDFAKSMRAWRRPDASACTQATEVGVSTSEGAGASTLDEHVGVGTCEHQGHGLRIVHEGVLCVLRRGRAAGAGDLSLEDLPADYSDKMKDSVLHAIDTLCTPMGSVLDTSLRDHIIGHLFTYTADGAAPVVKCGKLLQQSVPRLTLIIRDVAHQTRTSTISPILQAEGFRDFWSEVFNAKGAFVPSVQHSDAWRQRLEEAQKYMVHEDG